MRLKIKTINANHLGVLLVLAGAVLRLVQYLANVDYHIDECNDAMLLGWSSFAELFRPRNLFFGAPWGFLAVEKLMLNLFGDMEYSLRLGPIARHRQAFQTETSVCYLYEIGGQDDVKRPGRSAQRIYNPSN